MTNNKINKRFSKIKNKFLLPAFLRDMKTLNIGGLSAGNTAEIISDGDKCFDEFIKAIDSAKYNINLETYIFESDSLGILISNHLIKAAEKGIEVNVVYDAVGSFNTSSKMFNKMKNAGIEIISYNPIIPFKKLKTLTLRDHRKILVIDGKIAFVGGINIGLEYAGPSYNGANWRDTHLKIQGPAVKDIQFFFIENWFRNGGSVVDYKQHFPEQEKKGDKMMMIVCTKARKKIKPIRVSYLSAFNNAKQSIYITNAYFIPDRNVHKAIEKAAVSGVDVKLILPGKTDIPIVKYASEYLYKRYLKNGIKIYEYSRSVLHAKTAVIDGLWSTIGSSNLDRRSFRKNLEINAIVLDDNFGSEMEYVFEEDIRNSKEITLDKLKKRSPLLYFIQWLCYRFRNFL